jgi:hypothetical protein
MLRALLAVQGEIIGVERGSFNSHYKNSYADRNSILELVRPILQKHGLLLFQALVTPSEGQGIGSLSMTTTLYHVESAMSLGTTATMPLPKSDPHGYGSAATYLSRYSLVSLLAIPTLDDDDGNAASGKTATLATSTSTQKTPRPAPLPIKKAFAAEKEALAGEKSETIEATKRVVSKLWGSM